MISPSRVSRVRIVFLITTFSLLVFLAFFVTPVSRVATSRTTLQDHAARLGRAPARARASAANEARPLNVPANNFIAPALQHHVLSGAERPGSKECFSNDGQTHLDACR